MMDIKNIFNKLTDINNTLDNMNTKFDNMVFRIENLENLIKDKSILNISDKKVINKNINLCLLEHGFNLEKKFIQDCLEKNSIIGDVALFEEYYLRDDVNIPFNRKTKNISYYNKEWIENNNNYIENTLIGNIINTYIECMRFEMDEFLNSNYKTNLNYIIKLQTNKQYQKILIKSIFDLI